MPREVEPSLNEKKFFAKALQENIRLDGRPFDQYRALELEFGPELGVADVRLGKTRYIFLLFQSSLHILLLSIYLQLLLNPLGAHKTPT
jgi:exosome complex RNA-binding protein Rrp42 (RNase PH superfamily)